MKECRNIPPSARTPCSRAISNSLSASFVLCYLTLFISSLSLPFVSCLSHPRVISRPRIRLVSWLLSFVSLSSPSRLSLVQGWDLSLSLVGRRDLSSPSYLSASLNVSKHGFRRRGQLGLAYISAIWSEYLRSSILLVNNSQQLNSVLELNKHVHIYSNSTTLNREPETTTSTRPFSVGYLSLSGQIYRKNSILTAQGRKGTFAVYPSLF